jgi:site-specific DNA recombinase
MIICGNCGEIFRRVHWNNSGKRSIVWRCVSRLENTGLFCDARTVLESTIEQVLVTAINTTLKSRDSFLATLQNNIATVLSRKNDAAIEDIDKRIEDMQIQLLKLPRTHADIKQVTDEIYRLRDEKQKALVENAGRDDLRKRIAEMSIFLRKHPTVIKKYDEKLVHGHQAILKPLLLSLRSVKSNEPYATGLSD